MTWVRRTETKPAVHECQQPTREVVGIGDLWRCDTCGRLWTVVERCAVCRQPGHHPGHVAREVVWLPASWWQRLRYRNHGRHSDQRPPTTLPDPGSLEPVTRKGGRR